VVWRAAVKAAYEGRHFTGSQRQPGAFTVEGEVLRALKRIGAVKDPRESRFKAASRTDRGVSSLGNVFAFDTDFRKDELIRALNAATEKVFFYALAEVALDFSPRRARGRWYRYFLPRDGLDLELVREAADMFQGRHDFRSFCRAEGRSTVKSIDSIEILVEQEFILIDMRAREFLWNMVRRIASALEAVGSGRCGVDEVRGALAGRRVSFGLAPSESLVLMDVLYDFPFLPECPATLTRKVRAGREATSVHLSFFDALADRCAGGRL